MADQKHQRDDPTRTGAARTDADRARYAGRHFEAGSGRSRGGSISAERCHCGQAGPRHRHHRRRTFRGCGRRPQAAHRCAWKKSPVATANRKRVILARVGGEMVALAQPSACLTLPVPSGIRIKTAGSQARISTRLLDDEIDGTLIVAGCDPAVALLIGWMARIGSRINAVALPCSSGRALAALADGSVHVAGAHLRDPKSGDYNLAPVRSAVGRGRICVVNFARWEVGLLTAEGNPRGIRNFCDLACHDVRIVNRERGSGARQVLDEALSAADLKPKQIVGYHDEVPGHLEVAAAVHSGDADVGVAIRGCRGGLRTRFHPRARRAVRFSNP